MRDVIITPKSNGPLVVAGPVRVVGPDGRDLPIPPLKDGSPAPVVKLPVKHADGPFGSVRPRRTGSLTLRRGTCLGHTRTRLPS